MSANHEQAMMGAAVILLGYALVKHFNLMPAATTAAPVKAGTANGATFANGETSDYTSIFDLFSGTTVDTGAYNGANYLATLETKTQAPFLAGAYQF